MKLIFIKALLLSTVLFVSGLANAGLISFNDRTAFDSYTGGGIVDDLETAATTFGANSSHTVSSNDFTWTMSDFNCEDGEGCALFGGTFGNSLMMESDEDDFIFTYTDGSFNFATDITSFGLQFGSNYGDTSVTLNGLSSGVQASGSFFGIASDDNTGFTTVTYIKGSPQASFDDVSYTHQNNQIINVPEPSTLAIFALGMIGLASRRFKKQS